MANSEPGLADFTKHLRKWFETRQLSSETDYSEKLWIDIHTLFQVLAKGIDSTNPFSEAVCEPDNPAWTLRSHAAEFKVCQRIVNIFLFMDGLHYVNNGDWQQRYIFNNEQRLEEYLRCMLGHVALLQLYGDNCDHIELVRTVSNSMDPFREAFRHADISKTCANMNYRNIQIGTKLIGLTMARWMEQLKGTRHVGSITSDKPVQICNQGQGTNTKEATADGVRQNGHMPIVEMMEDGTTDVVKKLIKKGKDMTDEVKKRLIETVKDSTNPEKTMEDILDTVSKCTAPGNACVQSALESVHTSVTPVPPNPADHDPSAISASA
ncbi:hypothetical protein AK88_05677, partial [Plasmodium fragile]